MVLSMPVEPNFEDNDVCVGYKNPYDGLSVPGLQADALSWDAQAKNGEGQARTSTKGGDPGSEVHT